jgi:phenylpyruvate tautomerase PptA (4-oxalocrotonate tautomerase family)
MHKEWTMPLIKVDLHGHVEDKVKSRLAAQLSRAAAEATGKPERYVMVVVSDGAVVRMAGQEGPAAFVDVRGIGGLNHAVNNDLCRRVSAALHQEASVPTERVYLNFTNVDAASWGHGAETFG